MMTPEEKREYHREYRRKNKERLQQKAREYAEANRDKIKAYQDQYRVEHKEELNAYFKQHYEANKDEYVARSIKWQEDNRERHNEHVAKWSSENRDKHAVYSKKHRQGKLTDLEYIIKERYSKSKSRAKSKGLEFDLSTEYLMSIWPADGKCPVFGFEFDLQRNDLQRVPSLDRIDNNLGYVQGNVQFISYRANSIKQDSTVEELRQLLSYLESLKPVVR